MNIHILYIIYYIWWHKSIRFAKTDKLIKLDVECVQKESLQKRKNWINGIWISNACTALWIRIQTHHSLFHLVSTFSFIIIVHVFAPLLSNFKQSKNDEIEILWNIFVLTNRHTHVAPCWCWCIVSCPKNIISINVDRAT